MFDLPRKVKEFSCMCCGERFWTVEGSVRLFSDESAALAATMRELTLELFSASNN